MRVEYVARRQGTKVVSAMVAAVVALGLAPGVAHAVSEWWTPSGARCPVFDSANACQAYCAADPSRCGGSSDCAFRTGTTRPECAMVPPDKARQQGQSPDGWKHPDAP